MSTVNNQDAALSQMKRQLQKLNRKQMIFFSWLCAVRVFPLLGASGVIDIRTEKLMRYLYHIVYALDSTYASIEPLRPITATDAATTAIVADDVESTYGDDTRLAVKTVSLAVFAAYAANTDVAAAAEVAADAAMYAISTARYHGIDFSGLLTEDITQIARDEYTALFHDVSLYGMIWENFQKVLCALDCGYWGRLYADIFQSGFHMPQDLLRCRLHIPAEIQEQGAKTVGLYLQKIEAQGSECLNEARIIILGEKGAGKTCLTRKLEDVNAPMTGKEESTEGVATSIWKINGEADKATVNVHIWDFAGHVITHAAHRCFLSERCLYIIVYDGRTEDRNRLGYWLEHVRNYGGGAPVRILVNLFDDHKSDIPENTLKEKYPYIRDFTRLSIAKDKEKLEQFRDETASLIQSDPMWNCLAMPAGHVKVKEDLERRFKRDYENFYNEHISKEVFDGIVADNQIESTSAAQLLQDLHELGICLWYHDIKGFDTLVLNPDWISHGIYRLINWAHNNAKHMVYLNDHEAVFEGETARYPKDKLLFLFKLMKKYELAYSKETDHAITIPFLLREDRPQNLPHFAIEDSLLIQYVTEQPLPPNTVSRLIVRHSEEIRSNAEVWRYGVVLKYKQDTVALVKEDDRKIVIKVTGSHKSEYIAILRSTMNDIFSSYKGNKPELQYKIITTDPVVTVPYESRENKALMLSDETIRNYLSNGRPDYYYPQANVDIPLERTANIYNITTTNTAFGTHAQINSSIFNFSDCNLVLQGELRSLISSLRTNGYTEEAGELQSAIADLESMEGMDAKKDVLKSGGLTKLKNFFEDLENEDSAMRKVVSGVKYGVKAVQGMAKTYNDIAQWVGLPQVPKPFLGDV